MKSRYCFSPMTAKRIGRRMTLMDKIRRRQAIKRMSQPDIFPVTGYNAPAFPGK